MGTKPQPEPDVVYRAVPVYTASVQKQLLQSVSEAAVIRRHDLDKDVGAGVPKSPVVRELFVDVLSGQPIGEY